MRWERPETWKQAFYARDLAGTVVLVGVPTPDMTLQMPLIDLFSHGGALKSSWDGDCLPERDFPALVDLYQQGRLPLDKFVSERIGSTRSRPRSKPCTAATCCVRWSCCEPRIDRVVTSGQFVSTAAAGT